MSSGWRTLAEEWITLADQDLAVARLVRGERSVPDQAYGFHVQQAIEKSFKAVIATRGTLPPSTHDLVWLVERSGREHSFDLDELDVLSPYAAAALQPGSPAPTRHLNREHALHRAVEVRHWAAALVARTP